MDNNKDKFSCNMDKDNHIISDMNNNLSLDYSTHKESMHKMDI